MSHSRHPSDCRRCDENGEVPCGCDGFGCDGYDTCSCVSGKRMRCYPCKKANEPVPFSVTTWTMIGERTCLVGLCPVDWLKNPRDLTGHMIRLEDDTGRCFEVLNVDSYAVPLPYPSDLAVGLIVKPLP